MTVSGIPSSDSNDAPFNDRASALEFLRGLAPLDERPLPIAEAALALASLDRPQVDLDRYRRHLAELPREVARIAGEAATLDERIRAISTVLAGMFGYDGDRLNYEDLQNANLMRVIDRRKGLPVTLGILYLHAGRAQGWTMNGLAFPGHFLLRMEDRSERAVLDPFNAGRVLDASDLRRLLKSHAADDRELSPEHYAAVSDRDVLLRLQNNLKLRLKGMGAHERAHEVLERMRLLAPERAELAHESGMLLAELGQLNAALRALETALAIEPESRRRFATAALIQELKARLQ
jgi:regulator of sirC expression with transglutaminase-like and TPR domain